MIGLFGYVVVLLSVGRLSDGSVLNGSLVVFIVSVRLNG